jgi:hypothetical protein
MRNKPPRPMIAASLQRLETHERARTGNALLDSLSEGTRHAIRQVATAVSLRFQETIYEKGGRADFAFFPTNGFISNVSTMHDGRSVEVGIIGREGMTGFPLLLTGGTSANNLRFRRSLS